MQTPTAASDVFNVLKETSATLNESYLQQTSFPVDFVINKAFGGGSSWWSAPRITNARLQLESGSAETDAASTHKFDQNNGVIVTGLSGSSNFMGYHFKRARGFFDVVPYTGTGSDTTVNHNLGVAPEMIWAKRRNNNGDWCVYHAGAGNDKGCKLNETDAFGSEDYWNSTDPTASVFTLGGGVNDSSVPYISYLFATAAGVSKVGSFTQSGATNVACGFSGDTPSFILIKRTDSAGGWHIFDSESGIVAGNDSYLLTNSSSAPTTNEDVVDPYSGGFATTSTLTDGDYIFYAIAATS